MNAASPARMRPRAASPSGREDRVAQAVRNSLNLPMLTVEARRGPERGSWQVRLKKGRNSSDWLTLSAGDVAVIEKVSLLPPMLLGHFRLAYDAIANVDTER